MIVTAALIVRNEAKTLGRCLESVQPGVDQIVIVDTGSEDDTRRIAREYTPDVYDFRWHQDFGAARQFSFERATGDWVCWFDADDVVSNAEAIRECVRTASPNVAGFYWKYVVGEDEYGNSTCELWRERCVRSRAGFRWHGRVHEVLLPATASMLVRDSAVTVHHRPSARPAHYRRRNLDILEEEYEATKHAPEPRLLLYLGNEYSDQGSLEPALEFLHRYLLVATWDDEKYLAQVRIAALLRHMGRYDDAIDAALCALKTHPAWPQAHFSLGETYYFLQDWPKVIHWIECGRRLPPPDTLCVIHSLECRYDWIIHYCNALFHVGRLADALEWSKRALAIRPNDPWHLENVRIFESLQEAV